MSTCRVTLHSLWLVVAVATLTAGCTTTSLRVQKVEKGESGEGQIYYLPRVEFGVEVERELVACGTIEEPLGVENRVKVTPYILPDLSQVYRINYQEMRDSFKASEYTAETYPNGILKSVNTTLDDQTGDAIRGYLNGALSTLGALAQPSVRRVFESGKSVNALCNQQTLAQLKTRAKLKEDIAAKEPELHEAEQKLLEAEAQLAIARQALANTRIDNRSGAFLKALAQGVEHAQGKRDVALSERDDHKKALDGINKQLTKVRKALTVTAIHHFRPSLPSSSAPVQEPIVAGFDEAISAWIEPKNRHLLACSTDAIGKHPAGCAGLQLSVAVYLSTRPNEQATHGTTRPSSGEAGVSIKLPEGCKLEGCKLEGCELEGCDMSLVYRQPVEGMLMICAGTDCLDGSGNIHALSRQTLLMNKVSVPQLGFLATLPLVNKAFQNNTLQATFAEDGALTKVGYTSNARAAKQAGVFAESAESLLKFAEAKRAQSQEGLNAELAKTQAQKQLVEATLALERANRELDAFRRGESDGTTTTAEGE